jgi:hypothetical protein
MQDERKRVACLPNKGKGPEFNSQYCQKQTRKNSTISESLSKVNNLLCTSFYFIFYSFTHMCIHCLGHFSTLPPPPPSPSFPPQFQAGPVLPLLLILLKKRQKHNKEDKVFFLVELRIAIQKYS